MSDCPKCGLPDEPWCSGPCEIDPDCPRIPGYRGFQAGLKRGAEIARDTRITVQAQATKSEHIDWFTGSATTGKAIEQAILKEAESD